MSEVVFICTGNAARSQMAEAFYNAKRGEAAAISAGTEAVIDKPMPPLVIEAMQEEGIDVSHAKRKQLTQSMAEETTKIILMTEKSVPEYVADSAKTEFWSINDPRFGDGEVHRTARDEVKRHVDDLLERA